MSRSVRLRVTLELLDERGETVIAGPSEAFVQGSRLSELEADLARGRFPALDGDSNTVARTAFDLCRDSYRRIVGALTKTEAA